MSQRRIMSRWTRASWKLIVVALVAALAVVQVQSAIAAWALTVVPDDGPMLEFIAVCKNGMVVGVATQDEFATVDGDLEPWEMSIVRENSEDGEPFREVELDLEETEDFLSRFGEQYPFRQYLEIRWNTKLNQSERLGINFNDREWRSVAPVRVENCELSDNIRARFEVVGDDSTDPQINNDLEFEVSASNCGGGQNGCGIHHVHFFVIDPFGEVVHEKLERIEEYCAFGGAEPCTEYDFSSKGFRWSNGDPIEEGEHILRAVIRGENDAIRVVQRTVDINPS